MSASDTHISCTSLSFSWPDGTEVLSGFDLAVGPGRTGLIGLNGCGKSTLLRLIAGELPPLEGEIRTRGELGYLPQTVTLDTALRVDQALGIADRRAAIDAVEAGDVREELFAVIGDDWDVEQRARATLDGLGLGYIGLDSTAGEMSGGECVLLRLAALLLARPGVLLLDEPTNNLDTVARGRLYDAVDAWSGALLVVSHDRELLERVDRIADLRDGSVTWYGGNLSAYEEALAVEQEAAQRTVRAAESDVQRQKRELAEAHMKLARRRRYGQKMWDTKREPKV
ncbi:ABC-F family ATP-binding cassette domain-containing protein, partial [Streptomyces sp. SID8455]|nr:ABC-F family ATP-binding cassette domain-containing protein [Streptomyces sp. SID8455]